MTRRVTVLAVSEEEQAIAKEAFGKQDIVTQGAYLTGDLDQEQIDALLKRGVLLNEEPIPDPVVFSQMDSGSAEPEPFSERATFSAAERGEADADQVSIASYAGTPQEWQNMAAAAGIALERKIGPTSYVVRGRAENLRRLGATGLVRVRPYGSAAALDADLMTKAGATRAEALPFPTVASTDEVSAMTDEAEEVAYDVRCHDPAESRALVRVVEGRPGVLRVEVGEKRFRYWVTRNSDIERQLRNEFSQMSQVKWVEQYVPPEPLLSYAKAALLGKPVPPPNLPWRGAGQVIGICDSGVDAQHPDFAGRVDVVEVVRPATNRDPMGHGTHVASIAAGDGAASQGEFAGVAPEAKLFVQSIADENLRFKPGAELTPLLREAYRQGVRIQNLSWGSRVEGRYTMDSSDLDEFVYENPDFLIVVAAGNDGRQEDGGRMALKSLASPASGKNCLTVGACCSPRGDGPYQGKTWKSYDGTRAPKHPPMADFPLTGDPNVVAALSSRGPSDDGRVKPDLVAPGVCIAAACAADYENPRHPYPQFNGHYVYRNGTSMAAPLVTGAAALLRQYFVEKRNHTPTAALLKATLINGTRWLSGASWEDETIGIPNFHQGFGRLDLSRAFPASDAEGFSLAFVDIGNDDPRALRQGDVQISMYKTSYRIARGTPLSVTLTWTDPPDRGLQHELDLVLLDPSGKKHVGNQHLNRAQWESFDRANNVEQVRIEDPEQGEWQVYVGAHNTYKGAQGFALAITAAMDA